MEVTGRPLTMETQTRKGTVISKPNRLYVGSRVNSWSMMLIPLPMKT